MTVAEVTVRAPTEAEMLQVKGLWRTNSQTLGFLPEGAFDDALIAQRLLVAAGTDGVLLGYVLYRVAHGRCSIVHLCTSPQARYTGVAELLNERLCMDTKTLGLRGIGLYCRRDYNLNKFWSRLGYIPRHEKEGRSVNGSVLTYWWMDHHQADLFSTAGSVEAPPGKTCVVIDANVLFRMHQQDNTDENLSAKALAADWLQDQIELVVTEEVFVEINRSDSTEQRSLSRTWAQQHRVLSPDREQIAAAEAVLQKHIKRDALLWENDRSDFNHLARALAAGAPYLVTLDAAFLALTANLPAVIGIEVLDPATFVLRLDELRRSAEYAPTRLSGSLVQTRRVCDTDRETLVAAFQASGEGESRSQWVAKLRTYLSTPDIYETRCIVCAERGYLGLFTTTKPADGTMLVPALRFSKTAIGPTVARRVLSDLVSGAERVEKVRVTDPCVGRHIFGALIESGFVKELDGSWVRMRISGFCSVERAMQILGHNSTADTGDSSAESSSMPAASAHRLETALWPGKLTGSPVPTFIVAIRPSYAMHLFDADLASDDLIGANAELALSCENVYYRSNQACGISAPARILWYVTKDDERQGTMQVRACSLLDEVLIDTPKSLYRQFKRLGVYGWADVARMVDDPARDFIMALRFSHTELLKTPVPMAVVRRLGVRAQFQSPVRIPTSTFESIYETGMKHE